MSNSTHHPTLEVNLGAITRNYALLKMHMLGKGCAAVVKANAYGLGVEHIAPALFDAGCRDFFVARLEEGVLLRGPLSKQAQIYVFHGCRKGEQKEFAAHHLIPVLNDEGQIGEWGESGPCALHIDTGMRRLGLAPEDAVRLATKGKAPKGLQLVMSHLACAGEPEHPMNGVQLAEFRTGLMHFPGIQASLANSSGIFLGEGYHLDLARPGCSLYGISPNTARPNPVENVVTLSAPVLQYRKIDRPQSVGYGATAEAKAGSVLATVELGYADGLLRALSNKLTAYAAGIPVPVIGRVSMDMVSVDVSNVPEAKRDAHLRITFIGAEQPVDIVAEAADTIGYEIFTRLGSRVKRVYS
jgi:alanine racemase